MDLKSVARCVACLGFVAAFQRLPPRLPQASRRHERLTWEHALDNGHFIARSARLDSAFARFDTQSQQLNSDDTPAPHRRSLNTYRVEDGGKGRPGGTWKGKPQSNNRWAGNNNAPREDALLLKGAKLLVKALVEFERQPRAGRPGGDDRGGMQRDNRGWRNDRGAGVAERGERSERPDRGDRGLGRAPRADFDTKIPIAVVPIPEAETAESRRKKEKAREREGKGKAKFVDDAPKGRKAKRGFNDDDLLDLDGVVKAKVGRRKNGKGGQRSEDAAPEDLTVVVTEATITIAQLAERMHERAGEIIKYLMLNMGVMASITQSIDADTAISVAQAFGKKVSRTREDGDEDQASVMTDGVAFETDDPSTLLPRAPVVTIMGHVDHGKTSLLDAVRLTSVVTGEAGGITQHIGAYQVKKDDNLITFIDTPGHAAFSEMRERGANVTDIVVLVVAADEGVKDQTIEALNCAKQAHVPVLVAVNKIDKPGADVSRVKNELMKYDLLFEEFGGDVLSAEVSAKKRLNLEDLLEKILLQADVLDLKANPDRAAQGAVIEARIEKGLGTVSTVLVQKGTLKVGDVIVAGAAYGKVRSLQDFKGKRIESAGPSVPAVVSGWDGVPMAGDTLTVVESEVVARELAEARRRIARDKTGNEVTRSLQAQALSMFDGAKERKELTLVIKADVQGSAEAIATALSNLKAEDDRCEVVVKVLQSGVGDVTQTDVALAGVSMGVVYAFNVAADMQAQEEARKTGVQIEYHNVIYDILDKVEAELKQILSPTPDGELVGTALIKQVFEIGKVGKVAGCEVTTGFLRRGASVRVLRGTEVVFKGPLKTLRNVKTDVNEMRQGQECGMSFSGFDTFLGGDVVECYVIDKK